MKSYRRNVFETNSSSTHSLTLCDSFKSDYVEDENIPYNSKVILGNLEDCFYLIEDSKTQNVVGFKKKLLFLVGVFYNFFEDKLEYWCFEKYKDSFNELVYITWIKELLLEKCNIELIINPFSYSGISFDEGAERVLDSLEISLFFEKEFKNRVWEILSNQNIYFDYYSEEY